MKDSQEFIDYWCECGINAKKMRFEKESTFGLGRRIGTWIKHDFNNTKKSNSNQTTSAGGVVRNGKSIVSLPIFVANPNLPPNDENEELPF